MHHKLFLNHHHHVVQITHISLTLSRNSFLFPIFSGRFSSQYPVSVQSYCWYVLIARPTSARPGEGLHRRTLLMSSTLLLPVCLVRLIWMILEMGGRLPYSSYFVRCFFKDLFNIARNILEQLLSSFFSIR